MGRWKAVYYFAVEPSLWSTAGLVVALGLTRLSGPVDHATLHAVALFVGGCLFGIVADRVIDYARFKLWGGG